MWVKEHPKKEGNYWVRAIGSYNMIYKYIVQLCKNNLDGSYFAFYPGEERETLAGSNVFVEVIYNLF